jgi:hypothetical protein
MPNKYNEWLRISVELERLHAQAYEGNGPFAHRQSSPFRPTPLEAAAWLNKKIQRGGWYWWDKSTLAGRAEEPLRSLERVFSDGSGRYEESIKGAEVVRQIDAIRGLVNCLLKDGRLPKSYGHSNTTHRE